MKKNGFTLAEALIALGIVGIIAALALPMFNKTKPDPVKVAYLRTYDSIVSATRSLAKNEKLYPLQYTGSNETRYDTLNSNATFYDYPFVNTMATKDVAAGIKLGSGKRKLCDALFYSFGGDINSCVEEPITEYKDADFKPSFTTKDGTEFMVSTKISYKPVGGEEPYKSGLYETSIYFDVDGAKGNNCIYNRNTCKLPDRFKVFVLLDGTVKAADAMGKGYLKTRNLLNRISMVGKLDGNDVDTDAGSDAIFGDYCSPEEGLLNGQECKPCDPGQYIEDETCVPCLEGEVVNGTCVTCASQNKVWDGANGCKNCDPGYYIDGGGCRLCEGFVDENGYCDTCEEHHQYWDGTGCVTCNSPKVFDSATKKCKCPKFEDGGVCIDCDPAKKPSNAEMNNGNFTVECVNGVWKKRCNQGYKYDSTNDSCYYDAYWTGLVKWDLFIEDIQFNTESRYVYDNQYRVTLADRISKMDYDGQIYHEILKHRFLPEVSGNFDVCIVNVRYYPDPD